MPINSSMPSLFVLFKRFWPALLVILSLIFSGWIYYGSDYKLSQLLMSKEWQITLNTRISPNQHELASLGMVSYIDQTSHMVYLPNHTYSRVTQLKIYTREVNTPPVNLQISESGNWNLSGHYLITQPIEFKDITSGVNTDVKSLHLEVMKNIFELSAEQSQHVTVLNSNALLLSSLTYGSTVLYSL
jgi:transmembrane regulatory protein ToxS